jgi:hypothetical protein
MYPLLERLVASDMEDDEDCLIRHADFSDPTADVALVSKQGVLFRDHSWHLRRKR